MELTLYKAHRADGKGEIEGMPNRKVIGGNIKHYMNIFEGYTQEIKPETLSIYTGLNAEWFNEGIDPRIWNGDLFEEETGYGIKRWKVIYKNAAFYVQRLDDEEIEGLLFSFLDYNAYTKIGSIHDQK